MVARLFTIALLAGLLSGCSKNKKEDAANPADQGNTAAKIQPVDTANAFAFLHRSFKDATVAEPPDGAKRPPDVTAAGKSVGMMYEQIAGVNGTGGLWDQIRFVTPEGKRISYSATIKTDLGDIDLELYPDAAPNHVRNFVALAKVGYFDGLAFDFVMNQMIDEMPWTCVLAGCPLSTAEAGFGSIGYWLQPEYSDKNSHEPGTIGAWHDLALDSAASKFYINLTKAPWLDLGYTIFGRVTKGLEIAQKISAQPLQVDEGSSPRAEEKSGRPRQPVIMRSVTIHTKVE